MVFSPYSLIFKKIVLWYPFIPFLPWGDSFFLLGQASELHPTLPTWLSTFIPSSLLFFLLLFSIQLLTPMYQSSWVFNFNNNLSLFLISSSCLLCPIFEGSPPHAFMGAMLCDHLLHTLCINTINSTVLHVSCICIKQHFFFSLFLPACSSKFKSASVHLRNVSDEVSFSSLLIKSAKGGKKGGITVEGFFFFCFNSWRTKGRKMDTILLLLFSNPYIYRGKSGGVYLHAPE